jgi:hypothetical protein
MTRVVYSNCMTDRKFYKTVISIEVLSEEPIPEGMELGTIVNQAIEGDYSMRPLQHRETEINGKQAAKALQLQGSDPEFFSLTEKGEDAN